MLQMAKSPAIRRVGRQAIPSQADRAGDHRRQQEEHEHHAGSHPPRPGEPAGRRREVRRGFEKTDGIDAGCFHGGYGSAPERGLKGDKGDVVTGSP